MHLNKQTNTNIAVDNGFKKKIGKSSYRVLVYSSPTSREDFNDKLLRVIKNEAAEKAAGRSACAELLAHAAGVVTS